MDKPLPYMHFEHLLQQFLIPMNCIMQVGFLSLAKTSIFFSLCSILHGCGYDLHRNSLLPSAQLYQPNTLFSLWNGTSLWNFSDALRMIQTTIMWVGFLLMIIFIMSAHSDTGPYLHLVCHGKLNICCFAVNGKLIHTFTKLPVYNMKCGGHPILGFLGWDYLDWFHFNCGVDFCHEHFNQERGGGRNLVILLYQICLRQVFGSTTLLFWPAGIRSWYCEDQLLGSLAFMHWGFGAEDLLTTLSKSEFMADRQLHMSIISDIQNFSTDPYL